MFAHQSERCLKGSEWHSGFNRKLDTPIAIKLCDTDFLASDVGFGLGDMSRIDVIVDANGEPQVLEASVAPGMTDTSLLPMAITAAGLDLGKTLAALVSRAVERHRH